MHIYAFGSICRGEVSRGSDVDLLAIIDEQDSRFSPSVFSIYTYARIEFLWTEGNPFAWHLFQEARLLFSSDRLDFLAALGRPGDYTRSAQDCAKFLRLYREALASLPRSKTVVFELATLFLAIRNVATCYSLAVGHPTFSRDSARQLGAESLTIDPQAYSVLENARLLSTRGLGEMPSEMDVDAVHRALPSVTEWMENLVAKVGTRE